MDWDNVRVFLGVARAGQFLAAARQLGVDHATVSRRVGALEKTLGARLFDRRTNGCFITPAGEHFLAMAERVEAEMLRAQSQLSAATVDISGTVRIGAPDGFGTMFLAARLGKLMARHPGLNLQLVPLPRTFSLSRREADIAIVIERPEQGRLVVRKLTDYTLGFYAARAYLEAHPMPASLEDLREHVLVTYVQDMLFSTELNFLPDVFEARFRRFECASTLAQARAVEAGAGIGILHDYHTSEDERLVPLLSAHRFSRTYWLVTHADTHDLMRVRAVVDFIAQEVAGNRAYFNHS